MISQLSLLQAYDYYHTIGSKRTLAQKEKSFLVACSKHHQMVCDTDRDLNTDEMRIVKQLVNLYMNID